jgi:hypothetical protein
MLGTLGRLSPGDATSTCEPTTRAQRPPMPGNVLTGEGGREREGDVRKTRKAGERRDQGGETKMGGDGRGRTAPLDLGADLDTQKPMHLIGPSGSPILYFTAQHSTTVVGTAGREAQPKSLHRRAKL